ncbi:MAG TPA: hypothetical protein VGS08_01305 [Candidatus Saccharimonadales bacterium]|nr:hypothetical protein [Candidatus Saccharimonadales bacterium]
MANYELAQMQGDALIVAATINEIEQLNAEDGETWHRAQTDAASYIDSLYNEFVPNIEPQARSLGKALGSVGLALAEIRYGRDEHHPKLYSGSYEHNVLATYHHGAHPRRFLHGMLQYMAAINVIRPGTYDDIALSQSPGIAGLHDGIMGNGRGNDERQSGLLAAVMMPGMGFSSGAVETTLAAIDATTWSDEQRAQAVDAAKPHIIYQRAAGVGDLFSLFTRRGPYETACLGVEELCKQSHGQIFTQEAYTRGFPLEGTPIDECMEFIDKSEALQAAFGGFMQGQSTFYHDFAPADPALDDMFPGRTDNFGLMQEIDHAYRTGRFNAIGILGVTRDYMQND